MKTERQQDQDVAERLRRENLERANAPKDNEVDEKVRPVAWIVTNGGESCEPWLEYEQSEVDALPAVCIAEPLYSAATVAELRADRDSWRDQAEERIRNWHEEHDARKAAERRVGELEVELTKLRAEWQASLGWKGAVVHGTRANIGVIADALTGADPT